MIHKFLKLISAYTGDFSTHALLENSMLIREVLDEAMDFGYPQVTDFRLMKHYISTSEQVASYESPAPPAAVTNAVSNRPPNIFYNINEIYVDIIEELKFKQNSSGVITQNEVIGSIILKIYLSGNFNRLPSKLANKKIDFFLQKFYHSRKFFRLFKLAHTACAIFSGLCFGTKSSFFKKFPKILKKFHKFFLFYRRAQSTVICNKGTTDFALI